MKAYLKILSSHDIERLRRIILIALTLPGLLVLSAFIILGHILAYQRWSILLFSWNISKVSFYTGIGYLFLLMCSVLAHELGHLAMAVYIGEPSVEICVQFNSWLPTFMTRHNIRYRTSRPIKPLLNLAGVYTQLLFASSLGILFFFTHQTMLPASVLLIDIGALAPLVPINGTDGYWFFTDIQKAKIVRNGLEKSFKENKPPTLYPREGYPYTSGALKISSFFLFFSYIAVTLVLFLGVMYQWVDGWYIKSAVEGISGLKRMSFYEIFGYLTLLIPAIVYVIWAFHFLKMRTLFLQMFSKKR